MSETKPDRCSRFGRDTSFGRHQFEARREEQRAHRLVQAPFVCQQDPTIPHRCSTATAMTSTTITRSWTADFSPATTLRQEKKSTGSNASTSNRIPTAFTASPWATKERYNGKIFCLSEDGDTYVIRKPVLPALLRKPSYDDRRQHNDAVVAGKGCQGKEEATERQVGPAWSLKVPDQKIQSSQACCQVEDHIGHQNEPERCEVNFGYQKPRQSHKRNDTACS